MNATSGQTVGIVGVGALGLAVAKRLIAAGFEVNGYRRGSLADLAAAGGTPMPTARATALADPLILLLPNDAALSEVMADIAAALRPDQIILCLGTHRIPAKHAAADIAKAAGAHLLDGEVSGTPAMLSAGQASVMIAGDLDIIDRARPVLDGFAHTSVHVGAFGNATKIKLLTNYLVGVHTLAAAEVLLMGQRLGLDPHLLVQTITPSAGGSTMLAVRGRMMADRVYAGGDMIGFMRFFGLLRESLPATPGVNNPLLDLTEHLYRQAIASGHGKKDIAAICDSLAGLPPQSTA